MADGNCRTSTPGILSDAKENEADEFTNTKSNFSSENSGNIGLANTNNNGVIEEFPILDELDRLAKVILKAFFHMKSK